MAFLIPENIRTNPSIPGPRKVVAAALAMGLDDGATVWYEPPFDPEGERPHFVVLDRDYGVLVVMVFDDKDHWADDAGVWAAATSFGERIATAVAERPTLRRVVVTGFVAFPGMSVEEAAIEGFDSKVDLARCLFRDELTAIKRGDEHLLSRHFSRITEGGIGDQLSPAELDELRGIIHPEIVIHTAPTQPALITEPTEDVVKVMDRRQERLAKGLGSGHRVIRGVAGSGKTLVLLSRARLLASLMPGKPILVTCYNRALAGSLRAQLAEFPNVEVRTIFQVVADSLRAVGKSHLLVDKPDWDSLSRIAAADEDARPTTRYRAVLVDEAQDFDTPMLRICTKLFESNDPAEQDLVVVADRAQDLYRRSFTWKAAGIHAPGRTTILRTNYRNTREILTFAHHTLAASPSVAFDEGDADDLGLVSPDAAERSGRAPDLVLVSGVEAQIDAIVTRVRQWYDADLPGRSIAVLLASASTERLGERLMRRFENERLSAFWATETAETKDRVGSASEPIVVSTIHSSKGFEYPRVVVAGLPPSASKLLSITYQSVYVGMTRAVDELTVVCPSTGPLVPALTSALEATTTGVSPPR